MMRGNQMGRMLNRNKLSRLVIVVRGLKFDLSRIRKYAFTRPIFESYRLSSIHFMKTCNPIEVGTSTEPWFTTQKVATTNTWWLFVAFYCHWYLVHPKWRTKTRNNALMLHSTYRLQNNFPLAIRQQSQLSQLFIDPISARFTSDSRVRWIWNWMTTRRRTRIQAIYWKARPLNSLCQCHRFSYDFGMLFSKQTGWRKYYYSSKCLGNTSNSQ